jgi:hypothetical protein
MLITMNVQQRLNLEGIIRQQRVPDGDDLMTLYEMRKKIGFTDEERERYVIVENGIVKLTPAVQQDPPVEIDLERGEMRKLKGLLNDWKFSVDDVDWYTPLREALLQGINKKET